KLIGSHQIFGFLGDHSVLGRKEFGTYRSIQNIQKNVRQFLIAAGIRVISYQMSHQRLGYGTVDRIHGHMVSIVSGPAESQFRKVAGSDYNTSGLIGDIHKDLRSFSGLSVLIRHVMNLRIVTDIPE